MNFPQELEYTRSHEWVRRTGEGRAQIGLTDYAQSELSDLVFVNLPEVGDELVAGEAFADVESVKAASDVYAPVSGKVAAINELLLDTPQAINEDPYGAFLVEVSDITAAEELLDAAAYAALVAEEEAHK